MVTELHDVMEYIKSVTIKPGTKILLKKKEVKLEKITGEVEVMIEGLAEPTCTITPVSNTYKVKFKQATYTLTNGKLTGPVDFHVGLTKGKLMLIEGQLCGEQKFTSNKDEFTTYIWNDTEITQIVRPGGDSSVTMKMFGKEEGSHKTFSSKNNSLIKEVTFHQGEPHGPTRWWFLAGKPRRYMDMFHGKTHGSYIVWHQDGNISEIGRTFMEERDGDWVLHPAPGGGVSSTIPYPLKGKLDWVNVLIPVKTEEDEEGSFTRSKRL